MKVLVTDARRDSMRKSRRRTDEHAEDLSRGRHLLGRH
jgi:hypothetical protein